jgi:glycosyltransferase involved in cell wall biosynthesis
MSAKYRVAMVAACPFPCPRGTPVRIQRMSETLSGMGHEVHVITYHLGGQTAGTSLRVHRTPNLWTYRKETPGPAFQKFVVVDPLLVLQLSRVLRRHPVDLIHAHHYEGLLAAAVVARWSGHPVIYDAHTLLESELGHYMPASCRGVAVRIGRWLDTRVPRRADYVISVSGSIRDRLVALGAARADRITVVGNGVEQLRFRAAAGQHPPGTPATLIFAGNLAPYQGIELLLEAFGKIRRRHGSVRLQIVTEDRFEPYEELAKDLHVRAAIDVIKEGFEALPARLADADIALNPRIRCDGIPLKLLNYMSAALPIVSFAGSAHCLEQDHTARLVPDGDTSGFAAAVLDLLENPQVARRLGQNARRHSDEHFSWPLAARKIEAVYQKVLEERRSGVTFTGQRQPTV